MPVFFIISFITAFYKMKDNREIKPVFLINAFCYFLYFFCYTLFCCIRNYTSLKISFFTIY